MEKKKIKRLRQLLNEFILLYGIRPKTTTDELTMEIANQLSKSKEGKNK